MSPFPPYQGMGVAPILAAKIGVDAAIGIVTTAFTIFSAIKQKNQNIKDGITIEKMQVRAMVDEMKSQVNQLRLIRDGLESERTMLLGDRARKQFEGFGLFKSRQIKKEQVKLLASQSELDALVEQAQVYSMEIQAIGSEVQALRNELGVRVDEPLTLVEASMANGGSSTKQMLIIFGVAAALLVVVALTKKKT